MGKTLIGRAGRPLDKERTQDARTRHAIGVRRLSGIFNGGASGKDIAAAEEHRRISQGQGGSYTRTHWTRAERRAKGRLAKRARRANR